MRQKSFSLVISFLLTWVIFTSTVWARQVVTDDVKSWAKEALEQEKALKTITPPPDTVAILYFFNKTDRSDLNLLQRGLTIMLMTDLSKVKEIQVVERVKLQALVDELDLRVSGLVESDVASRLGKLLGTEHLVGGDIIRSTIDQFQLRSNLLDVPAEEIFGQPTVEGKLPAELFRMEKDLLFQIIEYLKIELSPELEAELTEVVTKNLRALLYLFEGIEKSDLENYLVAAEFYIKALEEDPNFTLAEEFLRELQELGLLPEGYSPPEPEKFGVRADLPPDDRFRPDDRRPTPESYEYIPLDFLGDNGSWSGAGTETVYNYWTGYTYGLQTVGQNKNGNRVLFTSQEELDRINSDGFLAYTVQLEEDRLNEQIIEMAHHADTMKARVATLKAAGYGDIRARDAALTEMADAQSGRVLKDKDGNWVRAQQYVLRPDANTVQLLNVCLRGEADLSTMDFTTTFTGEGYPLGNDLRTLPWNEWLDTQKIVMLRYVNTTSGAPELDNMYVKFTNPDNESLQETREFQGKAILNQTPPIVYVQKIGGETLTINNSSYTYTSNDSPGINQYTIVSDHVVDGNPDGFKYKINPAGSDQYINVAFYAVGDAHRPDNQGISEVDFDDEENRQEFKDIWDALRVNEPGTAPDIGNNNLEIAITDAENNFFNRPIDVIYIPMSRMLWRQNNAG